VAITVRSTLALSLLVAGLLAPSATAVTGEMRTLYVLATWGPVPFSNDDLQRVGAESDAFFRASSSGRFSMPASVAGPVQLPPGVFSNCDATALRTALPASMFTGYDRITFVTPIVDRCPFFGEANPTEVLLNGRLFRALVAHELGHTLSLRHASRWACGLSGCSVDEYGNSFSVMGGGNGDFNAWEKSALGWLGGIARPRGNGTHELGPVEGPTLLPQALVVRTAASEFWFESRGLATPSFGGGAVQPAGIAVLAGPAPGGELSAYPRENLLLPNPSGGARYAYAPGEAFVRPGIFRVAVERHALESAALRFEWLDRVRPSRPRLRVRTTRGRARLSWDAARERGSGIDSYTVVIDGRAVRTFRSDIPLTTWTAAFRVSRGSHRVGVYATDRAGNRGRLASARIRIR
jgi:Gametolysin peptidase M11